MGTYKILELAFGGITSAGVLYALLSPQIRKLCRRIKISKIIIEEMDSNYIFLNDLFPNDFEDKGEVVLEDVIHVGIFISDSKWKLFKQEIFELYAPMTFINISNYYDCIFDILMISDRMEKLVVDKEVGKDSLLKNHIQKYEYTYIYSIAVKIIKDMSYDYKLELKGKKNQIKSQYIDLKRKINIDRLLYPKH